MTTELRRDSREIICVRRNEPYGCHLTANDNPKPHSGFKALKFRKISVDRVSVHYGYVIGFGAGLGWEGMSSFERAALWVRRGQHPQRTIPLAIDRMRNTHAFSRRTSACSTEAMSRYMTNSSIILIRTIGFVKGNADELQHPH
jgi:hypothetical protein